MAEDDIYRNKQKYEHWLAKLDKLIELPKGNRIYYCRNLVNLKHFQKMIDHFEIKDLSYTRRMRVLHFLTLTTYVLDKDLSLCDRDDINKIIAFTHKTHKTAYSKGDAVKEIKILWKVLFPEKDALGRIDETIVPYPVRHLSRTIDKSKEKLRGDRLTWDEFKRIVGFFSADKRLQAYLMLSIESLGRPQEILYTRIKDYEFQDNFAKIWISEHGKEGTGFLQCIDSYPYVLEWYQQHPFKQDQEAFFFLNVGRKGRYEQLRNICINQHLKLACKHLGINKPITCYSLKRNGVTFRRQRGDSDVQIQHAARWTSTKQLKIYDMTTQEDALTIELQKRGIKPGKQQLIDHTVKVCGFCSYGNGITTDICMNCKRPLDRKKIEEMAQAHERMMGNEMLKRFDRMERMFESMLSR